MYAFHKTVRGYRHITKGRPCEDFSLSYSASNGQYYIIAVADGHGADYCFRSSTGSRFAINIAFECLQQFANAVLVSHDIEKKFYTDILFNTRYRRTILKQLTDRIVANWYDSVSQDYSSNPPSVEEMGTILKEHHKGNNITEFYGTTLIAALMLPSCLILLHQGDGRCDIFYEDGSVNQPIPWDMRCNGNITTSLCDFDVAESFRTCVINLNKKKIIACYLGSDGVEDAYRDTYEGIGGTHCLMGGVHTFYKNLSCKIVSMDNVAFEEYLDKMLPDFSANGLFSRSGSEDDVSVAGLVNIEAMRPLADKFALDIKEYSLEEELSLRESELNSKARRHAFLMECRDKAQADYERIGKSFVNFSKQLTQLQFEHSELVKQINSLKGRIDNLRIIEQEMRNYTKNAPLSIATQEYLTSLTKRSKETGLPIGNVCETISAEIKKLETEYLRQCANLDPLEEEIQKIRQNISNAPSSLKVLEKNFQDAEAEFIEYDSKYQVISDERNRILEELNNLKIIKAQSDVHTEAN